MKKLLLFAVFNYGSLILNCSAQQNKIAIDSLNSLLKTNIADSIRAKIFNNLCAEYANYDYEKAIDYGNKALLIARDQKLQKEIATALNNIGSIYIYQGKYKEALQNIIQSLKIWETLGDRSSIANTLNNIGNIYYYQSQFDQAISYYEQSLKIEREEANERGVAKSLYNIGLIYQDQKNNYEKATNYFEQSLKIFKKIGNNREVAYLLNSLGSVNETAGNFDVSLSYYLKSLEKFKEANDKKGIAATYAAIGAVYGKQNSYNQAIDNLEKGLVIAKEIETKDITMQIHHMLGEIYNAKKDYKRSIEYYKIYDQEKDSLLSKESSQQIIEMQTKYESEKKDKELLQKEAELQKQQAEAKRKKFERNAFIIGFVSMILFVLFIFRSLKENKKKNKIISEQKALVEEKNKEITDSITYAKRIQQAKLPKKEEIYSSLTNCFILFKPKDIVSGDFYFFHKKDQLVFIAAADCTGHGVPGAFMSMIGSERLEEAVSQTTETSEILKQLNKGIKTSLKQSDSEESTRDGMDIALCSVDTVNHIVKYAGANRPIWIIRKGVSEVEEIKATKKAIAGLTEDNQHFETHEIKLQIGDTFYISTDGYADQFGGEKGKKLMTKKYKEILLNIQDKTMKEQGNYLDSFMENWKAKTVQVDDILVIGVRL